MLKINLLNILSEPLPNKCNQLNTLLETSNLKDLYTYIEFIINFIFSNNQLKSNLNFYDLHPVETNLKTQQHSLNLTNAPTSTLQNLYQTNWPLKLVNRSQYGIDYDFIFNFLNTNSIFWLSLFKLDEIGAVFRLPSSAFPLIIQNRIDSLSSYLSSKLDSQNILSLSPLEFYFTHFFMFVHDNRTQSRKVFNEQNNCIELDSVYGDLLIDYLNFFLPITKQNLNFPSTNLNPVSNKHVYNFNFPHQNYKTPHKQYSEHPSLFKRSLKKSTLSQLENELIKSPNKILNNNDLTQTDRTNDIKKIDNFLRLINEFLVLPFTSNQSDNFSTSPIQNLTSLENVFTLSMILKHSHLFSFAFQDECKKESLASSSTISQSSSSNSTSSSTSASLAELRQLIFKIYWRKSFFKFFHYNLEHWSFEPNIKWLIELWLIYIQPCKLTLDFAKDNYFIFNDIYELIIKRYSIVDLTNFNNLELILKILIVFEHNKDLIKKCDLKFSQAQSQWIQQTILNKQEIQQFMRHNSEYRFVINLFEEFERPINSFRPLISVDNIKSVGHLFDGLSNAKIFLTENLNRKKIKKKSKFEWLKLLFLEDSGELNKMSDEEIIKTIRKIDECLDSIKLFYQNQTNFDDSDLFIGSNRELSQEEQQVPSITESEDYEQTSDQILKLTPKGRYKIINCLTRPKLIQSYYDPETAPIGDFENKFLVYIFQFVSDLMNENFSDFFDKIYQRNDLIGNLSKKCLYVSKGHGSKPRLHLRSLASYKFIFYFLVYLFLLKMFSHYSLFILIPVVFLMYFSYFLLTK
ncbi:unnamed protein product [Brachionus calyciflorus]|uniref:Sphingomyelin phosphodiesterase 4 n=1 Tax=Brachionus calyciflorus TaxID=104777 RepID=A0A813YV96_9BILA|nr:unnamed protein product [Brachionus calyciflorus]